MSGHTPGPWETSELLRQENERLHRVNAELLEAAKAWGRWEADLIWEAQTNALEYMSTDLYDRMLELQIQRNSAIDKAEGRS